MVLIQLYRSKARARVPEFVCQQWAMCLNASTLLLENVQFTRKAVSISLLLYCP